MPNEPLRIDRRARRASWRHAAGLRPTGQWQDGERRWQLVLPPHEVCEHTAEQFRKQENDEHYSWMWESALRLIENDKPDYRS